MRDAYRQMMANVAKEMCNFERRWTRPSVAAE
jgi:hypothetical protein